MKAKEMAERFNATPTPETVGAILWDLHQETALMLKSRNVKALVPMLAAFREQENKWKAFCRRCSGVDETAFKRITHKLCPEIVDLWP